MKVDSQNNFVVSEISSISSSDARERKNFLNRDLKTKAKQAKYQKGNWKFFRNLINLRRVDVDECELEKKGGKKLSGVYGTESNFLSPL